MNIHNILLLENYITIEIMNKRMNINIYNDDTSNIKILSKRSEYISLLYSLMGSLRSK